MSNIPYIANLITNIASQPSGKLYDGTPQQGGEQVIQTEGGVDLTTEGGVDITIEG